METANEVMRVVIELKESRQPAQLYNQRVRLINMKVCVCVCVCGVCVCVYVCVCVAMEIHCSK